MNRICLLILFTIGFVLSLSAAHIRGGELSYKYVGTGSGSNSSRYLLTLKLYIDCGQNQEGQLDEQVALTIFTKPDNRQFGGVVTAPMIASREQFIRYDPNSNPCISNPPTDVCYRLRYYEATIELPNTADGYTVSFQRCCRIQGIQNLQPPSNDVGATYVCEIPGTALLPDAVVNSSPVLNANDAVAICMGSHFEFNFSGVDDDHDSLVYRLCEAYAGGGPNNGATCLSCPTPVPSAPPPFVALRYISPYSGASPLGSSVSINSATGIISGTAPVKLGQFVITVCVSEYRRGVLINTHRKDIHIKVSDCIPLRARLLTDYSYCKSLLVSFRNMQINPTGSVYSWDFGDGSPVTTSTIPDGTIEHQYADTGSYQVKLKVVLAGQCVDSATTIARVYPLFLPGIDFDGSCLYTPFIFRDNTETTYGETAFWRWSFGDETTADDTSNLKNPTWQYHSLGSKDVQLIVASDKGCRDTISTTVNVTERPSLVLPFKDTLICSIDTLQLQAIGNGVFEWTPDDHIEDRFTATPIVHPDVTTTYTVTMTEDLCVSSDQVRVRVVDYVTLQPFADTTICATDTIQLLPVSDGLQYSWEATPTAYFSDPLVKNPFTSPSATTTYHVESRIGKCFTNDAFTVTTVPYPIVNAGEDAVICYDDTTMIFGSTDGSSFRWDPASSLIHANTLTPSAFPLETRTYTLLAYDTLGCPKPGYDQVTITVRPQIVTFAGNDTAVVMGQPLQLNGSGAEFFAWSPESYLSRTSVNNPVALPVRDITYILQTYTAEGCFSTDSIHIQVFKTLPDIFVPNAFVPQGRNNELKPKAVGISTLDYFRVFNRWGQLVFQTSELGQGWNGYINGVLQNTGTYVWMVSGTDYTGKKVIKKGTATLIR